MTTERRTKYQDVCWPSVIHEALPTLTDTDNNGVKKAALRQNDFGGVLGAPIIKDKLFFFGLYEGARVHLPRFANTYVPSLATLAAVQVVRNRRFFHCYWKLQRLRGCESIRLQAIVPSN